MTTTYPFGNFVNLMIQKVAVSVEMLLLEGTFTHNLVGKLSFQVHEKLEHLIVGLSGEHDSAGIQLVYGTSCRPHVYAELVRDAQDYLRGSIETRHQVRCYFIVGRVRSGTEVAQFQN